MSERDSEKLRGVADWVRSISIPDIDELVSRFLTWPVPASVHPDGTPGQPGRTGTNLMTAAEAKEMLLYVLASAPQASQPPQGAEPATRLLEQIDNWAFMESHPEEYTYSQRLAARTTIEAQLIAALAAPPQGAASPLTDDSAAGSDFEQELRSGGRWSPEMIERVAGAEPAIFNAISAYTPPGTHSATASPLPAPQEPARPDILEKLTYHQHERDDLTLDECWEVLASGYRKVHGRTDRQMVMQILALLAAAPAQIPREERHEQRT